MRFLSIITAVLLASPVLAQDLSEAQGAVLAQSETTLFEVGATPYPVRFDEININGDIAGLMAEICPEDVDEPSEVCSATRAAVVYSQAQRVQQMLDAQVKLEQMTLLTQLAVAEEIAETANTRRLNAQFAGQKAANLQTAETATGMLASAQAANALAAETGTMVLADDLIGAQGQLALVSEELADAQAAVSTNETAMQIMALDLLTICNDGIKEEGRECDDIEGEFRSQAVIDLYRNDVD
jgi:hypothetical protein